MKFTLDTVSSVNVIRAYAPGRINVNDRLLHTSFVISAATLVENWTPRRAEDISLESLEVALALEPEILVIGTGAQLHFLDARLSAAIQGRGIGLEVLDTAAACRTYTVLISENRKVAAALLMI
ncbi:MAG: hypothetical protein KGL00_00660 [Gammaproteobacteria bacterium]|nr:hypothetical protein [Gammaproteobacteria bacterium]